MAAHLNISNCKGF